MARLWRNTDGTREGKYLVLRRAGTVPEWMWFVMGSKDPAASSGLRGYASKAKELGYDPQYVQDIYELADAYDQYIADHGQGDPDAGKHREDDPKTIEMMKHGKRCLTEQTL